MIATVVPLVIGNELEIGQRMLEQCGWTIGCISETKPPREVVPMGHLRIVRQRLMDTRHIELVVSYESYMKEVK